MLVCDLPKSTYAARWHTKSIGRYYSKKVELWFLPFLRLQPISNANLLDKLICHRRQLKVKQELHRDRLVDIIVSIIVIITGNPGIWLVSIYVSLVYYRDWGVGKCVRQTIWKNGWAGKLPPGYSHSNFGLFMNSPEEISKIYFWKKICRKF